MKTFLFLILFFSLSKQILANDLIGDYFWASYKKQSNDYKERLEEMNKLVQPSPILIYKINNIYVELNEIDCFDSSCSEESPIIKSFAVADAGKIRFQKIISKQNDWECDDSDYFIKHCNSNVVKVNFDLYLNPIEEKDIKHLKVYQDEFAIIKELRKYKISAEYDDIPVKTILTKTILYYPKTLKKSFVLNKGNLIVVRKNKKIKNQYFMAGTGMGVTGLVKITDFNKNMK